MLTALSNAVGTVRDPNRNTKRHIRMPCACARRSCRRTSSSCPNCTLPLNGVRRRLRLLMRGVLGLVLAIAMVAGVAASCDAGTLETIRSRGALVCGVADEAFGYSARDGRGDWSGLAVDFCRALAIAVLGRKEAVEFRETPPTNRFAALQAGELDVLSTETAVTATLDAGIGLRVPGILAYGGQGFLVRRAHGVTSALELSGARVCVMGSSADAQGVIDYFAALKLPVEVVKIEGWNETVTAYRQKTCQVLSASVARLAAARMSLGDTNAHVVLPELAARHGYGPVIRQGDETWFSIVRWVMNVLVAAEDLGVTSANAEQLKTTGSADVRRLLVAGADLWGHFGLANDWPLQAIRQLGNYGELYERHLGARSALRIERGRNNLASKGGLLYAPPFQ